MGALPNLEAQLSRGDSVLSETEHFRVGHMGNVNRNDILARLAAIEASLRKRGHGFQLGAAISMANSSLAE